jgi:DnaK suppressor protein
MPKKSKKTKKTAKPKKHARARRAAPRKTVPRKVASRRAVSQTSLRYASKPVIKKVSQTPVAPLAEDQIQKFREILTQKRDDLMAIVQRKKEEEIEDVGVGDEADVATRSVEKEMLFELTDSEKQTLDRIEAALRKMEKGVYGECESCQRGIPRLRLQVMPWARYCINCQTEQEVPAAE